MDVSIFAGLAVVLICPPLLSRMSFLLKMTSLAQFWHLVSKKKLVQKANLLLAVTISVSNVTCWRCAIMSKYHVEQDGNTWLLWRRCRDKSETLVATFHPQSPSSLDDRAESLATDYCKRLNGRTKG